MVDHSRWAEIVANAELALASGRPLDLAAWRLAQMVVKTNELVTKSHDIFTQVVNIHGRCLADTKAAIHEAERQFRRATTLRDAIMESLNSDRGG